MGVGSWESIVPRAKDDGCVEDFRFRGVELNEVDRLYSTRLGLVVLTHTNRLAVSRHQNPVEFLARVLFYFELHTFLSA